MSEGKNDWADFLGRLRIEESFLSAVTKKTIRSIVFTLMT